VPCQETNKSSGRFISQTFVYRELVALIRATVQFLNSASGGSAFCGKRMKTAKQSNAHQPPLIGALLASSFPRL
jgi:hypothetical protein